MGVEKPPFINCHNFKVYKMKKTKAVMYDHVMIDLETMGTQPNAPIVSIGAVKFCPMNGVSPHKEDRLYMELFWEDQMAYDRIACEETRAWWYGPKVCDKAREALEGMDSLEDMMDALDAWFPKDGKVWGNGPTFDIIKMEDVYYKAGRKEPWKFWNVRCVRTMCQVYQTARGGFKCTVDVPRMGAAHNALDDAIHQVKMVHKAFHLAVTGMRKIIDEG